MKVEITCVENFQTVKTVIEVNEYKEISLVIESLRQAIKDGTKDIVSKSRKKKTNVEAETNFLPPKEEPKKTVEQVEQDMPVTQGQKNYLAKLGVTDATIQALRGFKEASELIGKLSGTKLNKKI